MDNVKSIHEVSNMRKIFTVCAVGVAMLLHGLAWAGVRDDEAAAVQVYKEVSANQVVYTYSVTNRGDRPIIGLTVGFDYYRGDTQLAGAHPSQILSPYAWSGRVVSLEESDNYEVSWDIAAATGAILPGKTMTGFRIIAAQDNPRFTSSNWTVIVDGPPSNASSALQFVQGPAPNVDTVPPQLHVTLTPNVVWPPNRRMVSIAAQITVQDDTDPNPRVKLDSITCSDCPDASADISDAALGTDDRAFAVRSDRVGRRKEGRVYKVIYSATDASGNVARAEAKVTVPHDQRR
ncbi:MAG TPA: hypothetical protein VGD30_18265 [Telluria sp.]